ncbi:MAG: hypothetical protein P9E24_12785 [Candidatus Competibacter sp.]|nr:hypothetical protein [Candidatus Competibacter sp.]MDG4583416.1 hypothetical protein [Candidatus Competibacter sp.]
MAAYPTVPSTVNSPAICLGASHGYAIAGDQIHLNADLNILDFEYATSTAWTLQLWAIDTPFVGGELPGIKVAEIILDPLPETASASITVAGSTFVSPPAGARDWTLLLVLAAGEDGDFRHIHAFANYPRPERFALPRILGKVGYRLTEDQIELTVDEIRNPRDPVNMSGTLSLELWALAAPYAGGAFDGIPLAGVVIGSLPGQGQHLDLRTTAHRAPTPQGCWHPVLMLREWTLAGYVTRDYTNFDPYLGEAPQIPKPVQIALTPTPAISVALGAEPPTTSVAAPPSQKYMDEEIGAAQPRDIQDPHESIDQTEVVDPPRAGRIGASIFGRLWKRLGF